MVVHINSPIGNSFWTTSLSIQQETEHMYIDRQSVKSLLCINPSNVIQYFLNLSNVRLSSLKFLIHNLK